MKLVVGTPWSSPFMWTKYVDAMLALHRPQEARSYVGIEPLEVDFVRGTGWCPAKRHVDLCEKALEKGADLICIVGADQIHPPDMLLRLIQRWNEGYEVISALVPTRGWIEHARMRPFQPMAWRIPSNEKNRIKMQQFEDVEKFVELVDPDDGEIQKINFIGSGVLMFHRDHLLALEKPWFFETVEHETQRRIACMDTKFVWRLQIEAGAEVVVDTTIKIRHLHDMEIDDTFQHIFSAADVLRTNREMCEVSREKAGENGEVSKVEASEEIV